MELTVSILRILLFLVALDATSATATAAPFDSEATSKPTVTYTAAPPDVPVRAAAFPTPFNPLLPVSELGVTNLKNNSELLHLPDRMAAHQAFATVPPHDHEAEGVFMLGSAPPYNAMFGTQTAYEARQKPLTAPVAALEQIFSPTMHLAWGNCLENSSYYNASSTAGASAHFTVFNFCLAAPTFVFDATIDATFLSQYVRVDSHGFPSYVSELFTRDRIPSGKSRFYSILYNFSKKRYDLIYSVPADGYFAKNALGWSIIEPYFAPGPCPKVAPALAGELFLRYSGTGQWVPLSPTLRGGATTFISVEGGSSNSCLLGDKTGPGTIDFHLLDPNWAWYALSPR